MMERHYYLPLKAQQGTLITDTEFKSLFSSFGSVVAVQRQMLAALEEAYAPFASDAAPEIFSALPIANALQK